MGASRTEREEQLWDLHQENEVIIPLEFTEEIKPDLFGLELVKAQEMTSGLSTTIAEREVLKNAYIDVIELEINAENLPIFKELRLKIVKNRTQGIEKWHKTNKAFYLAGGRFVDAVKNKEIIVNQEMEFKLLEAENYFENLERQKAEKLNESRIKRITPYVLDTFGLDFSKMSDYDFDDYLLGKKTRFENEQKEREAEALRIETERLADIERQKAIEAENAKLKAEAEAREIEIQKERAEAFAKQKAIQDETDKKARDEKAKQDTILEAQRKENERISKELQYKKEAEIKAKNERLTKIEAEAKEAEKLAKAPIKKQLEIWVDSFKLPECTTQNETSKEITEKFESFKSWAKNQINQV